MKLLQSKLAKYTAPQEAKEAGIYPYFRAISSEQDPEVIINGRKVLMFGSNCYTGLVNDPRIKEAAIEATRKYGTGCAGSPFLNGTLDLHKQLEAKIGEYIGKEDVQHPLCQLQPHVKCADTRIYLQHLDGCEI